MAKSARADYVKWAATQITTRREFESKPEWRATITIRNNVAFILEGEGIYEGRFYEYAADWIPRNGFSQIEMESATFRRRTD